MESSNDMKTALALPEPSTKSFPDLLSEKLDCDVIDFIDAYSLDLAELFETGHTSVLIGESYYNLHLTFEKA